jgi:hypothetical protein
MPTTASTKTRQRTPKTNFHTLLVFRCPTELSQALADLAVQRRTSVSGVIRELLREGLKTLLKVRFVTKDA